MQMDKLPPEAEALMLHAANQIMLEALPLCDVNPAYSIGAMALALGSVAAIMKIPMDEISALVGRYYENELLKELEDGSGGYEGFAPKKDDKAN